PHCRQVDLSAVGEYAVHDGAAADVTAAAANEPSAGRPGHVTGRTLAPCTLSTESIARQAQEVRQQEARSTGIAIDVAGIALDDRIRQLRLGGVDGVVVIAAAVVVERAADPGIAPVLVDTHADDRIEEHVTGIVQVLPVGEIAAAESVL